MPICTAQVLLSALREKLLRLPPLHNYPEIDGIVLPIRKKIDWFLNGVFHDDFGTNVKFFQYVQPFPLTSVYSFVYILFDRHV